MGHHSQSHDAYEALRKRFLDAIQGAADSPLLMKILGMLYSPEDADLARRLPHNLTAVDVLSRRMGIPDDELDGRISDMARRGLVFDVEHGGRRYCMLPPVLIGIFELVFMRARPEMPMKEMARLFEEYLGEHAFMGALFEGKTQQFRSLVHEETIPPDAYTEVLDWERATSIVSSASGAAVGHCQCHSVARQTGHACDRPEEVCLTFDYAAESMVRNGMARPITKSEASKIIAASKEAGLAQTADNVKNKVSFICNCCKCCCHLMKGVRALDPAHKIVTSNFVVSVDLARCTGCGTCADRCLVDAMAVESREEGGRKIEWAACDELSCLGCGVCATVCTTGAATMRPRSRRVLVPEDAFEQRVMMAIERGKLASLVFGDPERLSHRALSRIVGAVERSRPVKAWMAAQSLNSSFLKQVVKAAKRKLGDVADVLA